MRCFRTQWRRTKWNSFWRWRDEEESCVVVPHHTSPGRLVDYPSAPLAVPALFLNAMMNAKYNQPIKRHTHTHTPVPTPLDSYLTTVNIIVYVLYGTHYAPSVFFVIVSLCGPSWSGPGFKYFKIISNTKVVLDLSVPVAIEPIEKAKKAKPHPPGTPCRLKQMLKDLEWYLNPGLPGPTCSCH